MAHKGEAFATGLTTILDVPFTVLGPGRRSPNRIEHRHAKAPAPCARPIHARFVRGDGEGARRYQGRGARSPGLWERMRKEAGRCRRMKARAGSRWASSSPSCQSATRALSVNPVSINPARVEARGCWLVEYADAATFGATGLDGFVLRLGYGDVLRSKGAPCQRESRTPTGSVGARVELPPMGSLRALRPILSS